MLEETIERSREIAVARAQLMEYAAQQGVSLVEDVNDIKGSSAPADNGDDNIDVLLRLLREWRDDELKKVD